MQQSCTGSPAGSGDTPALLPVQLHTSTAYKFLAAWEICHFLIQETV